jgi:hypothetical protein
LNIFFLISCSITSSVLTWFPELGKSAAFGVQEMGPEAAKSVTLFLEDGSSYVGKLFGSACSTSGEVGKL